MEIKNGECVCLDTFISSYSSCDCPVNSSPVNNKCQCNSNYYNNGTNSINCQKCMEFCSTCVMLGGTLICEECFKDYQKNGDKTVCNRIEASIEL